MRRLAMQWLMVLLAFTWPASVQALDPDRRLDEYTLQSWNVRDGLPHNMVHAIEQDADGFLWVATWEGLARFDGRHFVVHDNTNIPGLQSRAFRALHRQANGTLLFGAMREGVWERAQGGWLREQAKAWTTAILRGRDGTLWLGTENGLLRRGADGPARSVLDHRHGVAGQPWVHDLVELADGRIWAATESGLFELSADARHVAAIALPEPGNSAIRALLRHRDGSVWVAQDRGLLRHDGARFEPVPAFAGVRVDALLQDRHGAIWANTSEHGVLRWLNGRRETLGAEQGLSGRGTPALLEDREGLIWVGTTNGLFRIADGPVRAITTAQGLSDDYVRSVLAAADGSLWIGTSAGLDRWRDGTLQSIDLPWRSGVPASVMALAQTAAGIWVGTFDEGILLVPHDHGPVRRLASVDGMALDRIRALLAARDRGLWIGTANGLVHRDADGGLHAFGQADGLPAGMVRGLHETAEGDLWIALGDGIARRMPSGRTLVYNRRSQPAFPADTAFDFHVDPQGTVWIGSDHGIVRFRDGRFDAFGRRQGLPNESIFRVLPDAAGDLWLSSNRGVFHIARAQLDAALPTGRQALSLDVFDESSGMPSSQANGNSFPAGARDGNGLLWIPTSAGLALIDTVSASARPAIRIATVIESVAVNDRAPVKPPLSHAANTAQRIAIQYAGLNFRHAQNIRYRYRLEGFDRDWVEAGSNTQAVFTNLPPGQYRFRVQSSLQSGDWTQGAGETATTLILTPAFWQQPAFQLLGLLLLMVLLVLLWQWRLARYRHRQHELSDMVHNRTRELNAKNQALEIAARERHQLLQKLEFQATHDELTGLWNRRAAAAELTRLARSGQTVHAALIDVDHFKRINDVYGHETGDLALQALADLLRTHCAAGDGLCCARLGGEEFVMLFHGWSDEDCHAHCERLRQAVASHVLQGARGQPLQFAISIGLSRGHRSQPASVILREADAQLYRAKHAGRNRVCSAVDVPIREPGNGIEPPT